VFVCGREADAWFPNEKVVVEIDDLATHGDPQSFADNRRLDARRAAHGILTVRLLAEDLKADPAGQAKGIEEILASRRV
jgi:very-short-patch-repair endonuclease